MARTVRVTMTDHRTVNEVVRDAGWAIPLNFLELDDDHRNSMYDLVARDREIRTQEITNTITKIRSEGVNDAIGIALPSWLPYSGS